MPNMRIIAANAADTATIAASTTAGTLGAGNLQNDYKGRVHRSVGTSVTYTLTWSTAQSISAVALPACNLTAAATIRVRLYSDAAGATLLADSGTATACPGLDLSWWSGTVNANAFAYGALAKTAVWFASAYSTRRCVIDIADATNPAGYVDVARLVVGAWWSPTYNASVGAQAAHVDTTVASRNDAGDLVPDLGIRYDTLSLDLRGMPEADRAAITRIFRAAGTGENILVSLLPGTGTAAEWDHMVYGKRTGSPGTTLDGWPYYSTKLELQGW